MNMLVKLFKRELVRHCGGGKRWDRQDGSDREEKDK